ncbi:MAG: hypothetical protein AAFX07_05665 [Pseudomonadota bacterium]
MYTLWFGIIWTVLAFTGLFFFRVEPEYAQQELLFRIVMTVMPFAGFIVIWDGLRKLCRFRSVRREETPGGPLYVWTELDGSEMRSSEDPRLEWDKEDRNFAD